MPKLTQSQTADHWHCRCGEILGDIPSPGTLVTRGPVTVKGTRVIVICPKCCFANTWHLEPASRALWRRWLAAVQA